MDPGIVGALYAKFILSSREKEDVESQSTVTRMNEKLLSIMCYKSQKNFEDFLDILVNENQQHIADPLRGQRDINTHYAQPIKVVSFQVKKNRQSECIECAVCFDWTIIIAVG